MKGPQDLRNVQWPQDELDHRVCSVGVAAQRHCRDYEAHVQRAAVQQVNGSRDGGRKHILPSLVWTPPPLPGKHGAGPEDLSIAIRLLL